MFFFYFQANYHFMKKLPKDAEASNILVGELNNLKSPLSVFIRLNKALHLGDLTEVPVPTRFLFVLLAPKVRWKKWVINRVGKLNVTKQEFIVLASQTQFLTIFYASFTKNTRLTNWL